MRTFAHFGTDDREHRMLRMAGEMPEPAETPEAPALPETVDVPVETPEAASTQATEFVETANTDIANVEAQIGALDTQAADAGVTPADIGSYTYNLQEMTGMYGTPDTSVWAGPLPQPAPEAAPAPPPAPPGELDTVPATGSDLYAAMRAMGEQPDSRVPLDAPVPIPEAPAAEEPDYARMDMADMPGYDSEGYPLPETPAAQTPATETPAVEPDYARMDMADMPGYDSEGYPLPPESAAYNELADVLGAEMTPIDPDNNPLRSPSTGTPLPETPAGEEPATETSANPDTAPIEPLFAEEPTEAQPESTESLQPASETATETSESNEAASESYETEKNDQRVGQERQKFADVSRRQDIPPTEWGTIENGKTDGTGQPFLYKEGSMTVNGVDQPVLLAYSPNGGVQVMNVGTGEWKFMSQMSQEEQNAIKGADGMTPEARDAALAAERNTNPEAYDARIAQNEINLALEEACLKNPDANIDWFRTQVRGEGMWKGNDDIYDALAASLETSTDGTTTLAGGTEAPTDTPSETTDTPADATETNEDDPEMAALKKQIEELTAAVAALTARIDALEGGAKPEEGTEDDGEEDEGTQTEDDAESDEVTEEETEKDEAVAEAERVLENPDSTEAERAEAVKTITDATLDELDGKAGETSAEEAPESTDTGTATSEIAEVKEAEESTETDEKLRSRLIAEVRNAEPPKTVDAVRTEKEDAFKVATETSDEAIDKAEEDERAQSDKVDDINQEISDLRQERANAKPADRGAIDTKITEAQGRLEQAQADLRTMEQNRETLMKNQETASDKHDREIAMLDKLETEWEQTAERTDKKFDEMGAKLIDLGQPELGALVQAVTVKHDGSLGLEISLDASLIEKIKEFLPEAKDQEDLGKGDNPAPALRGIGAFIATLEAQADQPAEPTPAAETPATETPAPAAEPTPAVDEEASRLANTRPSQNFRRDPGVA